MDDCLSQGLESGCSARFQFNETVPLDKATHYLVLLEVMDSDFVHLNLFLKSLTFIRRNGSMNSFSTLRETVGPNNSKFQKFAGFNDAVRDGEIAWVWTAGAEAEC